MKLKVQTLASRRDRQITFKSHALPVGVPEINFFHGLEPDKMSPGLRGICAAYNICFFEREGATQEEIAEDVSYYYMLTWIAGDYYKNGQPWLFMKDDQRFLVTWSELEEIVEDYIPKDWKIFQLNWFTKFVYDTFINNKHRLTSSEGIIGKSRAHLYTPEGAEWAAHACRAYGHVYRAHECLRVMSENNWSDKEGLYSSNTPLTETIGGN